VNRTRLVRALAMALAFGIAGANAVAQQPQTPPAAYEPSVGQAGKDVVWVPTPQALVDKMLDMAKVTTTDYLIDLGSGDGRTVITAAKRGVRSLGIEYNPQMVELSQRNAENEGVAGRARFVRQDLFESDLSQATVITMFLLPSLNQKLRPRLLELAPGTRLVSNSFDMGDWEPDEKAELDRNAGCNASWCTALFWIVPAKVAGTHSVAQGELVLEQKYQMLTGTLRSGGQSVPVKGRVRGNEVVLDAGGRELRGAVKGKRLELR
jgi:hypothetical protein